MDEQNDLMSEALRLAELGWQLFPIRSGAKAPPSGLKWRDESTTDPNRLREWFGPGRFNIGLAVPDGVVVIDVDPDGLAEFGGHAEAFDGPKARTPRGGWHLYARAPEGVTVKNWAGRIGVGLDTRVLGGYVVSAPSARDGKRYEWVHPLDVSPADLPECPAWLADRLRTIAAPARASSPMPSTRTRSGTDRVSEDPREHPHSESYGVRGLKGECSKVQNAPEGTRNTQLNTSALKLARLVAGGHLDEAEVRGELLDAALTAGLPEREAAATINSGFKKGLTEPRHPAPRDTKAQRLAGKDTNDGDDSQPANEKASAAELAVRLALELGTLGISTKREPFIVLNDGPNVAHLLTERGGTFRDRLASEFRKRYKRVPGASALADGMASLRGDALDLTPTPLALRTAEHEGSLVIDLGSESGEAVVITPEGWAIVGRSPILFQRTPLTGELPRPERGGSLDELRELVNVSDGDWPLVLGFIVAAYFAEIPHPVAMLGGQQGAGKSTAARMIFGLFDPSPAQLRSKPRDEEACAVGMAGSWGVCYDNLSDLPGWLSDAICKAVTGDAWVRRKLYTDGELAVSDYRRIVGMTSISAGALRGDLGERSLLIDLEPIEPGKRRTERELLEYYNAARPRILGALLDLVAGALARRDSVEVPDLPRMADFARILAAIDETAGVGALPAYLAHAGRIASEVVNSDSVATSLLSWAEHRETFEGSAQDLLDMLRPADKPGDWPRTAHAMAAALRRVAPAIGELGVQITFPGRNDRPRHYKIDLTGAVPGRCDDPDLALEVFSATHPAPAGRIGA